MPIPLLMKTWCRRGLIVGVALGGLGAPGCVGPVSTPEPVWGYAIAPDHSEAGWTLHVSATFEPAAPLVLLEPRATPYVQVIGIDGEPVEPTSRLPSGPASSVRYRVDLEAMARDLADLDVARWTGGSIVSAWTAWLIRPRGANPDARVTLQATGNTPESLLLALPRSADGYRARGRQLGQDVHAVVGEFQSFDVALAAHTSLDAPHARIDVGILGDGFRDPDPVRDWCREAVQMVANVHGGLPVSHGLLLLLPIDGRDEVVFGRVLPSAAPTVLIWAGTDVAPAALRADWVLVHELLHLGMPPVHRDARWLDEGISTYLEPLVRARAGWITEVQMWEHFVDQMPRGLRALEQRGLSQFRGIDDTYWGGALFCFLYDLEARRRDPDGRGLEGALGHCVDRGMTATARSCSLERLLTVIDEGAGSPIGREFAARYVDSASPVHLERLWLALGVRQTPDGIVLDDDAPESWLRHSLLQRSSRQ